MAKTRVLAEPVLVERKEELEELKSYLESAALGKGRTVFISGEAGSGKTRLTREFLDFAKKKGAVVMAGWCLSDAQAPYFPFVEAFHSYSATTEEEPTSIIHQHGAAPGPPVMSYMVGEEPGITAWLTGSAPVEKPGRPEAISPQVWKDQVYAGVAGTLHSISATAPVILLLEDIHWADSASLALLHYLARKASKAERILLIATFRSEELTADAEGRPHPLAETLRLMRREDLFTEIRLQNLSQASVAEIAKNMIGGNLQPQLAEKLTVESKGNPLFVVESLRMLNEQNSLVQEDDQWRLIVDEFGLPSKIKDIILRRLAALKYTQRRVLDAASVIGEKFDVELLSIILGADYLEVLETLNVIAHSTSLVSVEENFYKFDHARSRETLYGELSSPLKQGYHQRVAERLENTSLRGKLPYSDLAYHYAQAGNADKAEKYALAAGKDALERFSNAEAIKQFAYILQIIPETPEKAESKKTALEGLGDAYYANKRYADAIKTFKILADKATGAAKQRAYIKEMEAVWFKGSNPNVLLGLAKKAEQHVVDRLGSAYIHHNKGRALLHMNDMPGTLKEHEEALRIFKEEYNLSKTADLTFAIGTIHAMLHMEKKGFSEMLQALNMFHELGDLRGEMMVAHRGLGGFLLGAGLLKEAEKYFGLAFQIGEKIGSYDDMAIACDWLGSLELRKGRASLETALSYSLKALEYVEKTDAQTPKLKIYSSLVFRYALLGDLTRAEEYFAKLVTPIEAEPTLDTFRLVFAKIALMCVRGQWEEAEKEFEKNESSNSLLGRQMYAKSMHARFLEMRGKDREAKTLLAEVEKLMGEAEKKFAHVSLDARLMARKQVTADEELDVRLDIVNFAKSTGYITRIDDIIPAEFKVTATPASCTLQGGMVEPVEKAIGPFEVKTVKLKLKAMKPGNYMIDPCIEYVDDLGEKRICRPEPVEINIQWAKPVFDTQPSRITTGCSELDRLLLGGIPEKYAVILSSASSDEREWLVGKFLEAGAKAEEITLDLAIEAGNARTLAEQHSGNFFLVICNPQADLITQNLSNVYRVKGVESLTDIDIALTKMFRIQDPQSSRPKRIYIGILSDILLQHHAVNTRRWLSALLPTLKSKGFTILAVIDPQMHPSEENQAIRSLFDGEIELAKKGAAKTLRVAKLVNRRYLDEELTLEKPVL